MTKVDDNYKLKSNYHTGSKERNCYFCNCGPPLREHHIIPQRFDGPDTKDNTVELCDLCHKRLERLYDKSFYEWFGIEDETGERHFHRPCQFQKANNCNNQAQVKARLSKMTEAATGEILLCWDCAKKRAKTYQQRGNDQSISPEEIVRNATVAIASDFDD